jgi:hypothetical protein
LDIVARCAIRIFGHATSAGDGARECSAKSPHEQSFAGQLLRINGDVTIRDAAPRRCTTNLQQIPDVRVANPKTTV